MKTAAWTALVTLAVVLPIVAGTAPTIAPLAGGPLTVYAAGSLTAKYFLQHHDVDVFFGYCSSHDATPDPDLRKVEVPADLSVPVDYGMSVVLRGDDPARRAASFRFALYAMSPAAQERPPAYGFRAVAAPEH